MIYQQYKTAVAAGYRGKAPGEIEVQIGEAAACRRWLESLEIAPEVRGVLVEQIRALEAAFSELLVEPSTSR